MTSGLPTPSDQQLRRALLDADAAVPRGLPPTTAADLLAAARRRRTQRARVRTAVAATCAVAMTIMLIRPSAPPEVLESPQLTSHVIRPGDLSAELAQLNREAALQEHVVRRLLDAEQLAVEQPQIVEPELAAQEAARSAAISLEYAAIVERDSADSDRAREEYQRVSRRFPGTTWAALAMASLDRLSPPTDDPPSL